MFHSLFTPSPTDGHLVCFQCLDTMTKTVVNILYKSYCEQIFFFLLDKYLGMEWLNPTVDLGLVLF